MTSLSDHLAKAAVTDGDVPVEVAEWVDAGARPDPPELAGLHEDSIAVKAERWQITGPGSAGWAVRLYLQAEAEKAQVEADYERERRKLDLAKRRALEPATNTMAYTKDKLTVWALAQRREHPKRKTFATPAGQVATRVPSKPWTVEVADKEALLRWALADQRDAWLRPTLQPITEIRKGVEVAVHGENTSVTDEDGVVVPGLAAVPTVPTVIIRPEVD